MINSITGTITRRSPSGFCIQTGGIEFEVDASQTTIRGLPAIGSDARVLIFLLHREDAMRLYGFADEEERYLFHQLMRVSGIGAKQALRILSGSTPSQLRMILESEDVPSLTRIPGLGTKTAQKIILTLRGSLVPAETEADESVEDEIVEGLVAMGFDRNKAKEAVRKTSEELVSEGVAEAEREGEVFRRSIVALSGSNSGNGPGPGRA